MKSEDDDDERKLQSSQLHQSQTEEHRDAEHLKPEGDGEECAGAARNSDPRRLQAAAHDEMSHSCETKHSGLKQAREQQSGLNALKSSDVLLSNVECDVSEK